jgi:hypothetical protein
MDFRLFPASDLGAEVLVESSGSPSGYGSRCLTPGELGNLWDVPILFLDSLSNGEVSSLMKDICRSPLSKLLHTGADVLLTAAFRGGCKGTCDAVRQGGSTGDTTYGTCEAVRQGGSTRDTTSGVVPGPRPHSDEVLGLPPVSRRVDSAAGDPTDLALAEEVTKGDSQKADNAAVPNHLWLRAFVLGYGTEDGGS